MPRLNGVLVYVFICLASVHTYRSIIKHQMILSTKDLARAAHVLGFPFYSPRYF